MSTNNLFCVIYRTGGYLNYQWHRTLAMPYTEARVVEGDIRTMGYAAYVERYSLSLSVGLPETFAVDSGPVDPEDWAEYEDREAVRSQGRMEDLGDLPVGYDPEDSATH